MLFLRLNIAGSFRPLKFVKYLPDYGWNSTVITVDGRSDISHDQSLLDEVPPSVKVYPTPALDPLFCLMQMYRVKRESGSSTTFPENLKGVACKAIDSFRNVVSIPDIQIYWALPALVKGLQVSIKTPYDIIITTSPPPSCHLVGFCLSKITRKPWIADFRDPWVDSFYFSQQKTLPKQRVEQFMERLVITCSSGIIANTEQNRQTLLKRYGTVLSESKVTTITNGFDRDSIDLVVPKRFDKFTICHTGVLYPALEPFFFLKGFANWLDNNHRNNELRQSVQVLLVGSKDDHTDKIVRKLKLEDCVFLFPRVTRLEAISLAKGANLLLVSLGFKKNISSTIPGKLYDYLGTNQPILGMLPENGAAADLIKRTNTGYVVSNPDYQAISSILYEVYTQYKDKKIAASFSQNKEELSKYEAYSITKKLAALLDDLV